MATKDRRLHEAVSEDRLPGLQQARLEGANFRAWAPCNGHVAGGLLAAPVVQFIVKRVGVEEDADIFGRKPIHVAAGAGRVAFVEYSLGRSTEVSFLTSKSGWQPHHEAISRGRVGNVATVLLFWSSWLATGRK